MDLAVSNVSSLQSEDGAKLLDDIDRLRSHGITQYVSLPQIIVVGDQSSGKSSVLEAITGVAFPTNDGLCTRFATEIILRRSSDEKASARIRPSTGCPDTRREKLEGFRQTRIALAQVSGLIAEATKVMGIAEDVNFSEDILELEISGPQQPHLTLVDLPGIFHTTTFKQNKDDPARVNNLVTNYMRQESSIILAIISGKYDYAVQQILGMLKSVDIDPEGHRTMGVITKPDAIERNSADEETFLSLARNSERPLKLGWHVLRNPSFIERRDTGFNRDSTETQFFANQAPWNTLPARNVGVVALRLRLSRLLFDHITSKMHPLVDSIGLKIAECKSILSTLGPERSSNEDRKEYLTDIGERFRRLAEDSVKGHYEDDYFTLANGQRLRANVEKANEDFAKRMLKEGHRWSIVPNGAFSIGHWGTPGLVLPPEGPATTIERSNYIRQACDLLEELRGRELPGNYNPLRVRELFKRQSVSWKRLACDHTRDVLQMVKIFVEDLIEHVAGQERAEILLKHLIDPATVRMQEMLDSKVAELLTPYTDGFPMTLNPEYIAAMAGLNETGNTKPEKADDDRQRINRVACSRLVDCMQSYYKIALGVFMDNIATLAIENCVLKNVANLISALTVARMSAEQATLLASESPDDARTRRETLIKMEVLQDGLETCERHNRRRPGQSRPSKGPSNTGRGAPAGATLGLGSSPSRPVTPGLTPTSTLGRSGSMSASHSEPGAQALQYSPAAKFNFDVPTAGPSLFARTQSPGRPPASRESSDTTAGASGLFRVPRDSNDSPHHSVS